MGFLQIRKPVKTLVLLENVQQSVEQKSHCSITSCSLTSKYIVSGEQSISLFCCLILFNLLTNIVKLRCGHKNGLYIKYVRS